MFLTRIPPIYHRRYTILAPVIATRADSVHDAATKNISNCITSSVIPKIIAVPKVG